MEEMLWFRTGPGKPAVRDYRGAPRNAAMVELLVAFRLFGDLNVRRQFRFGEGILNGYKLCDNNRQVVS
jgi:hypothetical protein